MADNTTSYELIDAPAAEAYLPGPPWWPWAVSAGLVLAVITLVVLLRRGRKKTAAAQNPRVVAYHAAVEKLDGPATSAKEAATRASLALREYLAASFSDPSLYETHEEFISRRDSLPTLPDALREEVAAEFDRIAPCKYGPDELAISPDSILTSARGLLDRLDAVPTPP